MGRLKLVSMRRFAAFAVALTMLHLNTVRADAACATHEDAAADAGGTHDGMSHETDAPAEQAPCDAPAQQDCCLAFAACSVVLSAEASALVDVSVSHPASVVAGISERPASRSTAPEPPPPKA
jgi:hypothetical protein